VVILLGLFIRIRVGADESERQKVRANKRMSE